MDQYLRRRRRYTKTWFTTRETGAERSAAVIVPYLYQLFHPRSVVDVGCGLGAWLAAFSDAGVETLLGIDGEYVDRGDLKIAKDCFHACDLREPFRIDQTFDVALCLEVGEHIPPSAAGSFIRSVTELAPVVVFSAAIPHQGGTGHVNEQWPDYWAALFAKDDYIAFDPVRPRFWADDRVRYFYAQNTLVYVRRGHAETHTLLAPHRLRDETQPRRLVHPKLYENALARFPDPGSVQVTSAARFLLKLPVRQAARWATRHSWWHR